MKETITSSSGTTFIDGTQSVYKAGNDWADVLQEVNELKNVWNQNQDRSHRPHDYDMHQNLFSSMIKGSSFLSDQLKKVDVPELLEALPAKSEVDKLVYQYFNRRNLAMPIARKYDEHWKDPPQTNVMWLGLLFSILAITMLSFHQFDNEPPGYVGRAEALFGQYRLRTAQCLMIGDIAKCLPYTLETLLLNSTAELARKDDNARGLWMMTGFMLRAAINMGYHRDPSQAPSISVLQGELRRRVWLALTHKDDLASFLVGFPSMMPSIYSDTQEPRNIHDWELSEETTILPQTRPMDESTPVTYLIAKGRLMSALGKVTDFHNALKPASYETVLEIDRALDGAFQKLPLQMKIYNGDAETDSEQSQTATTATLIQMEFLYNLGMCSLHRKFLSKSRLDPQYSLSQDRCISSALVLLNQQQAFHYQAPINNPVLMPDWYKIPQARQFFVLAAMILFLELEHRRRASNVDTAPESGVLLDALERSCTIWKGVQSSSDEAWRVYHVLTGMLSSFLAETSDHNSQSQTLGSVANIPELEHREEIMSRPGTASGSLPLDDHVLENSNDMDIDWVGYSWSFDEAVLTLIQATWDSFIEGTSFEEAYEGIQFNDNELSYTTE
ncbi:Pyrrolocin cluster transcription factor fsdR [Hyphodiscus hymeniophilus]|uniref:Pyrrolocin cluster transcription factor fsdR n=1 Tax=Hyphodiscus hymeniophilus TaxID=353542 RepID=A0A9P7AYL9_9HELO|nr:Pyrrolocin cluster transcription factor fsdR [Hyphodiscus hymeniophilus]